MPRAITIEKLLMALLIIELSNGFTCYSYWNGDAFPSINASSYCRIKNLTKKG
jgi:hypothetical protein